MKVFPRFGVELYEERLDNGSNVFLFKRKGMPIYLRSIFVAGSRFDSIPGIAHYLEHMLLAGTKKFPQKNLLADYIQKIGGDFGASTSLDFLKLNVEIPVVEDLDTGIEIINECLINPLFESKTVETERGSILSEYSAYRSNPREYVNTVFFRSIFKGLPLGHGVIGDEKSIDSIRKDDLLDYKANFIQSKRATFIVSGDIEMSVLTSSLNKIKLPNDQNEQIIDYSKQLPIIDGDHLEVEIYPHSNHLHFIIGIRTFVESYKEYCALIVLNNILSKGRGSRLVTKLRYENGLIYSVSGSVSQYRDWGTFKIKLSCDKNNFEKVKGLVFEEFNSLRNKGLFEDELENTKNRILKGLIIDLQTSASWINAHEIEAVFSPSNMKTIEDYTKTVENLTAKDLQAVIDKYLKAENFHIAICGDYK